MAISVGGPLTQLWRQRHGFGCRVQRGKFPEEYHRLLKSVW
jgi:hypothetical protein